MPQTPIKTITARQAPDWYACKIETARSHRGMAETRLTINGAFGEFMTETDPITGYPLTDVWAAQTVLTTTMGRLQEVMAQAVADGAITAAEMQSQFGTLIAADLAQSDAAYSLVGFLTSKGLLEQADERGAGFPTIVKTIEE